MAFTEDEIAIFNKIQVQYTPKVTPLPTVLYKIDLTISPSL